MRREACTAQSAFVGARHALACKVGCKREVGCETALRAVRDGFIGGFFGELYTMMPKFIVIGRYVFFVYSADRTERAYIHVRVKTSALPEAKFWLVPVVELTYNKGFNSKEISDIRKLVMKNAEELLARWHAEFNQDQSVERDEVREAFLRGYDKLRWLDEAKHSCPPFSRVNCFAMMMSSAYRMLF